MYPCPVALLNENFSRLESETHGSILLFTQWKYFAAIVVNFFFFFQRGSIISLPSFPFFVYIPFIARYILV